MAGPAPAAREPLNRRKVLHAAVELADAEGLRAVSMRRVAEALGVVPMALYKHVADKEDLLDGLVEVLIADMRPSASDGGGAPDPGRWREDVREAILAARTVVERHPWARRALESRTRRTPAVLGHMERVTAVFLGAGFSPDLTHHVMHLLGNRIWGFSPELFTMPTPDAGRSRARGRRAAPDPVPDDYPGIMAIVTDAEGRRPGLGCDEDFEFDFALTVLLDAAERLRQARWDSAEP